MSEFYPFAPRESQLEEYREDARRSFSRIGWACFAMMLVMQGGAALLMLGCQLLAMRGSRFMIAFIQSEWFQWVITDAANYGLGLPVLLLILRPMPLPPALPRRPGNGEAIWGAGADKLRGGISHQPYRLGDQRGHQRAAGTAGGRAPAGYGDGHQPMDHIPFWGTAGAGGGGMDFPQADPAAAFPLGRAGGDLRLGIPVRAVPRATLDNFSMPLRWGRSLPMWRCAPGASAIRWRCTSW